MVIIPMISVEKRLRVFMATARVGIKAQINKLDQERFKCPSGAKTLAAVNAPKTAGAM